MSDSRAVRRSWMALVGALVMSCDNPARMLDVPQVRTMRVFMILDPDSTSQVVLVQHASGESLLDLRGQIFENATLLASTVAGDTASLEETRPCGDRYGVLVGSSRCVAFQFRPLFAGTYGVNIVSTGRDTAHATTTVPGDFRLVSHELRGALPGPIGLRATWTKSTGVFRYVVAVRGRLLDFGGGCDPAEYQCPPDPPYDEHPRWLAVTEDTTIDATIESRFFDAARGPWVLDVYAMNRDVYAHLMTGASGSFFPVPPAQNVVGGLGAVGAWVRRSVALPP